MTTVTRYLADDGSEFKTEALALSHEMLCKSIETIMSKLPPIPDNYEFSGGVGWVQHHPTDFWRAYHEMIGTAMLQCDHPTLRKAKEWPTTVHPSHVARIISECCHEVMRTAFHRFCCTNFETLREYGQPYFASHPDEAEGGCINTQSIDPK